MERFRRYMALLFIGLVLILLIIIFNQLVLLYHNLSYFNKYLGLIVPGLVVVLLAFIVGINIYALLKYPKTQRISDNPTREELEAYKEAYLERLKKNRTLRALGHEFKEASIDGQIQSANEILKVQAMEIIKDNANSVFLTTAISQNGVLDGLSVLYSLGLMIYRLVDLYENRPGFYRLIFIYGQVASVVLAVGAIEDLDLIEDQLEPIIASLLGSSFISAIPGGTSTASFIVNSLVEGSVNALLTLRVGIVTSRYLSATEDLDKGQLRAGALMEATPYLGSIIASNGKKVILAITRTLKRATLDKIRNPLVRNR